MTSFKNWLESLLNQQYTVVSTLTKQQQKTNTAKTSSAILAVQGQQTNISVPIFQLISFRTIIDFSFILNRYHSYRYGYRCHFHSQADQQLAPFFVCSWREMEFLIYRVQVDEGKNIR